jgi:hypothetical protein
MYYTIGYCLNAIAINAAIETESSYQTKRRMKLYNVRKEASDKVREDQPEPYEPDYDQMIEDRGGLDMVLYAQKIFTGR